MDTATDKWFETQILVHEAALMRFLARSWSRYSEIEDLRQEVYVKVYEAACKGLPHAPKSFLFATARNLLIDRIRRSRVVSIEAIGGCQELDSLQVLVDEAGPEKGFSARQDLRRLAAALDDLPSRCREVLWLRRIEDLPQKEVARRLNVSEGAVEKALARALQILAKKIFAGETDGPVMERRQESGRRQYESRDGKFESD